MDKQSNSVGSLSKAVVVVLTALFFDGFFALVTGIWLALHYKPTTGLAYQSVKDDQFPMLRNMHHWSSALLIILGGLYVLLALLSAAYKTPNRRLYVGSLALIGLGLLMQLTGHLLPWDQQAVRTSVVETGIAGGAPVIGTAQANLLRAGDTVGPATLSLWYNAHVYILSIPFLVLLAFVGSRIGGVTSVRKWTGFAIGSMLVVLGFVAAPIGQMATSADFDNFTAKPEWYVLPLHSLLNIFQAIGPNFAFIGTMVIPGLVAAFLVALPWIDNKRGKYGKPTAVVLGIAFLVLAGMGASKMAPPIGDQIGTGSAANNSKPLVLDATLVAAGKTAFAKNGCDDCHRINGKGGNEGPELTNEASRHNDLQWQILHLQHPDQVTPGSTMPSFAKKTPEELKALASYVLSKK